MSRYEREQLAAKEAEAASGWGDAAADTPGPRQIAQSVDEAMTSAENVAGLIRKLHARLEPVLKPRDDVVDAKVVGRDRDNLPPLALQLTSITETTDDAASELRDLLHRLEL